MYSDTILNILFEDIEQTFAKLNKNDLGKLDKLDEDQDYDYIIGRKVANQFNKFSNFFTCDYGHDTEYGLFLSFNDNYSLNNINFQLGYDGYYELLDFLNLYLERYDVLPKIFLTDVEINKIFGVPKRTLQNWKNREDNDWRYNLYTTLKYKGFILNTHDKP